MKTRLAADKNKHFEPTNEGLVFKGRVAASGDYRDCRTTDVVPGPIHSGRQIY